MLTSAAFFTADRKLSPLSSQHASLDGEQQLTVGSRSELQLAVSIGLMRYSYSDYVGLDAVNAVDATAWALLVF